MLMSAAAGSLFLLNVKHEHQTVFSIDVYAHSSRLNGISPSLKFWTVLILMSLCLLSKTPVTGLIISALSLCLVVFAGGLKLSKYLKMIALPISFLMLSGLALLIEFTPEKTGTLSVPIFNLWLSVSKASQIRAGLIMSRAMGSVGCLYLLSLTTPMSSIIGVLRRAHCPNEIISLMYLIYRYTFIMISTYHTMRDAADSRMGFSDFRGSMRTTALIYSGLLARSYRQAGTNFDAMESRCYSGEIRFLERK